MSYRSDKQVNTAHTDGRTHRQTQATTIPEGQNWTRVKIMFGAGQARAHYLYYWLSIDADIDMYTRHNASMCHTNVS